MVKEKKKNVLITGVAGFVGSNFAKRLLNDGYSVIGIDNLSQSNKKSIRGFEKIGKFDFFKADVRRYEDIKQIVKRKKIDYIVHLAAFKIPRYGNAMDTLMVNSKGTENMLEIATEKDAKLVFSSTSDVYGKNTELPFSETSNLVLGAPTVRRWAYASSKMFDEHLCFAYQEKYGTKMTVLRFFGGYGPNQNTTWWGGPQSVFIDCALKNKAITLHGDGSQTRSFTFIDDMARGVQLAMEKRASTGEILNIGNNREISIKELANMIWGRIRDTNPKIKCLAYDKISKGYEDVVRRIPDIRKSQKILGFKAGVQLEQGLPLTIDWQRSVTK